MKDTTFHFLVGNVWVMFLISTYGIWDVATPFNEPISTFISLVGGCIWGTSLLGFLLWLSKNISTKGGAA